MIPIAQGMDPRDYQDPLMSLYLKSKNNHLVQAQYLGRRDNHQ